MREQVWGKNRVTCRLFRILLPLVDPVCIVVGNEAGDWILALVCAPATLFLWWWVLCIVVEEHGKLPPVPGWQVPCIALRSPAASQVIPNFVPCWLHAWHKHPICESDKHTVVMKGRVRLTFINVQSILTSLTQSTFSSVTQSYWNLHPWSVTSVRVQWLSDPKLICLTCIAVTMVKV